MTRTVSLRAIALLAASNAAVARGARQYILIGASFDSFALRLPDYARQIEIFDLDHPATQQLMLHRFRTCSLEVLPSVSLPNEIAAKFAAAAAPDPELEPHALRSSE